MELSGYSIAELVKLYSQTIKELKERGVLRTKNVVGELGEYLVLEYYDQNPDLPSLNVVPVGTKNINAVSQNGERYSIKSSTGNVTGVIYGLQPPNSNIPDKQLFEYVVICKMDDNCDLEGIYQLSWEDFLKHKKWHSRMKAWNIAITKAMKNDAVIIYEKNSPETAEDGNPVYGNTNGENAPDFRDVKENNVTSNDSISWNKTEKVNHALIRKNVAEKLGRKLGCPFDQSSQSRFISPDRNIALFVLSASFSQKNNEYWYSINDENIPWLSLFPRCYIAFALGSDKEILLFSFTQFKKMLNGCLRTKEDASINKKAHYHFSFAVEGSTVYFKKKVPERDFVNVTKYLV